MFFQCCSTDDGDLGDFPTSSGPGGGGGTLATEPRAFAVDNGPPLLQLLLAGDAHAVLEKLKHVLGRAVELLDAAVLQNSAQRTKRKLLNRLMNEVEDVLESLCLSQCQELACQQHSESFRGQKRLTEAHERLSAAAVALERPPSAAGPGGDENLAELVSELLEALSAANALAQPASATAITAVDVSSESSLASLRALPFDDGYDRLETALHCFEKALAATTADQKLNRTARRELCGRLISLMADLEADTSKLHECVLHGWDQDHPRCLAVMECCAVVNDAASVSVDAASTLADAVEVLVQSVQSRAEAIASMLLSGGEPCVEMVGAVLEHALDAGDKLAVRTPRQSRQPLRDLIDRLEVLTETIDEHWCKRLSNSDDPTSAQIARVLAEAEVSEPSFDTLSQLAEVLVTATDPMKHTSQLLGSTKPVDAIAGADLLVRLVAAPQPTKSPEEIATVPLLMQLLRPDQSALARRSAGLALTSIGVRNTRTVAALIVDEGIEERMAEAFTFVGPEVCPAEVEASAALNLCYNMCWANSTVPELASQQHLESSSWLLLRHCVKIAPQMTISVFDVFVDAVLMAMARIPDTTSVFDRLMRSSVVTMTIVFMGEYGSGAKNDRAKYQKHDIVLRKGAWDIIDAHLQCALRPAGTSAQWWQKHATDVTAEMVHMSTLGLCLNFPFYSVTKVPVEYDHMLQSGIAESMAILKMTAAARVLETLAPPFLLLYGCITIVTVAISKSVDTDAAKMAFRAPDIIAALSYAAANDLVAGPWTIAGIASTVLINLLGRNESGAELSRTAAESVLFAVQAYRTGRKKTLPLHGALKYLGAVEEMAIADRNKHFVYEYDGALEDLAFCLVLGKDHERANEAVVDEAQLVSARTLLQLALSADCADRLRKSQVVMDSLRILMNEGLTAEARRCGKDALFQLEGRDQVVAPAPAVEGSNRRPKHVMLSYCWDQQAVVKRVHAALVERGYNTWIDIEQMMGSDGGCDGGCGGERRGGVAGSEPAVQRVSELPSGGAVRDAA